jgi:hydrogenase maturation protein HypF
MITLPIVSRKHIEIRGIVQGVGFRPFVYQVAQSLGLTGYVFNSSSGLTIEIEGRDRDVSVFLNRLSVDPPQLAVVTDISVSDVEANGDSTFCILRSRDEVGAVGLVSPDLGICDACWRELGNPTNRRYGYPFTNCTHCGPRYTIINDIPYDRATTSMSAFTMCNACQAEYDDPNDRRFHAQPNACGQCGPSVVLVPRSSSLADCSFTDANSLATFRMARALLHEGKILAVKGLGGFLFACDATDDAAVAELRKRKRRPEKPFALMVRDIDATKMLCGVSPADEVALRHPRRPIVVMSRLAGEKLSEGIAPGNSTVGVMLPYMPLHYLLFSDSPESDSEFPALVMTSGNISEEPIIVSNEKALQQLSDVADWFLLHDRDIAMRVDDSIVHTFEGRERVLRRSRGFVPRTIDLGLEMEEVLAFGGQVKNTFCLTKSRYAILSPHIGDLENYETIQFFDESLDRMKHLFRVAPRVAAYDLHLGYRSTQMALGCAIERKIGIQHHHAHIVSCMAENGLRGNVIGVAFDGTGFGLDGRIWGGEFLVANFADFTRRAHMRYVMLPGGDSAVRQPWRMALSFLRDAFGRQLPSDLKCFQKVTQKQFEVVDTMIDRRIQSVETSSCGRLFDAVAAMLGLVSEVTFEGQAAMALETVAARGVEQRYPFALVETEPMVLDFRPTIEAIVKGASLGQAHEVISARFHNTLGAAIVEVCCRIRKSDGLNRVCLSGGTFQNLYLLDRTVIELRRCGFGVFLHATVPANDGGISLGQAVIASELAGQGD